MKWKGKPGSKNVENKGGSVYVHGKTKSGGSGFVNTRSKYGKAWATARNAGANNDYAVMSAASVAKRKAREATNDVRRKALRKRTWAK